MNDDLNGDETEAMIRLLKLPNGSVLIDKNSDAWQKINADAWYKAGEDTAYETQDLLDLRPVNVIYDSSARPPTVIYGSDLP